MKIIEDAFDREDKLKVRLAVLEAEHAAYLDALAVDGLRPTTVMIGIESLKSLLAGAHANRLDADARGDAAIARAEKAEDNLAAAQRRIVEMEAERDLANGVNRRATQTIIGCIGSVGPEDADSAAERIVSRFLELERANGCTRETINAVDKVLTQEARHPPSLDIVGRVRGLAAQANGLAAIVEERGKIISQLEAQLQAAQDTSIADRAMAEGLAECERFRARNAELEARYDGGKNCLISRAVAGAKFLELWYDNGGVGCWHVRLTGADVNGKPGRAISARRVSGAEVRDELARMLTEVGA